MLDWATLPIAPLKEGVLMKFVTTEAAIHAAISEECKPSQERFPVEFRDGARCGFLQRQEGPREPGGYPRGFHRWPLERRNAWFAGFNVGFHDRLSFSQSEAVL
jgi:hypothetical protein